MTRRFQHRRPIRPPTIAEQIAVGEAFKRAFAKIDANREAHDAEHAARGALLIERYLAATGVTREATAEAHHWSRTDNPMMSTETLSAEDWQCYKDAEALVHDTIMYAGAVYRGEDTTGKGELLTDIEREMIHECARDNANLVYQLPVDHYYALDNLFRVSGAQKEIDTLTARAAAASDYMRPDRLAALLTVNGVRQPDPWTWLHNCEAEPRSDVACETDWWALSDALFDRSHDAAA